MIKAVFFDLDDTLCDSDTAWHIAVGETFQLLCKRVPGVSEEAFTEAWTNGSSRNSFSNSMRGNAPWQK